MPTEPARPGPSEGPLHRAAVWFGLAEDPHETSSASPGTPPVEHLVVPELARFETDWRFSHVVRARGLLLLAGVTGTDERGWVSSDPLSQFERAFEHLRLYLAAADATFDDLLEITTYHVGLRRHLASFTAVKDRHLTAPYPAWSAIGVSELITEGALVEIRAIARDPRAA